MPFDIPKDDTPKRKTSFSDVWATVKEEGKLLRKDVPAAAMAIKTKIAPLTKKTLVAIEKGRLRLEEQQNLRGAFKGHSLEALYTLRTMARGNPAGFRQQFSGGRPMTDGEFKLINSEIDREIGARKSF